MSTSARTLADDEVSERAPLGARNALVHDHLDLVELEAHDLVRSLGRHADLDELKCAGRLGLVEASARFDPRRGVAFRAYAKFRVRGAMIDSFRKNAPMSRRAYETLSAAQGVTFTAQSVQAIGVAFDDAGELEAVDPSPSAEELLEHSRRRNEFAELANTLSNDERQLVVGHYIDGERFDHIARRLGISKSWASRLQRRSIITMKEQVVQNSQPQPCDLETASPSTVHERQRIKRGPKVRVASMMHRLALYVQSHPGASLADIAESFGCATTEQRHLVAKRLKCLIDARRLARNGTFQTYRYFPGPRAAIVDDVERSTASAPATASCSVPGCLTKIRFPKPDGLCGIHRAAGADKESSRARREDAAKSSLQARAPGTGQVFLKKGRWYAKESQTVVDGRRYAKYIGSFDTQGEAHAACDEWVKTIGEPKREAIMPTCSVPGCSTRLNERSLEAGDGICGVHRAGGWSGKITTTTTHSQSVEMAVAATPSPTAEPLTLPEPPNLIQNAAKIGESAVELYRKLREERAAIAIRSAELDEQIRHLAPLATWSDRLCAKPAEVPPHAYADKRSRHFSATMLDDMEELERIVHGSTDPEGEWDEYIDLLNSFDTELVFYARIGLEHCAQTRNGVTMAAFLWGTLEALSQVGPCDVCSVAVATSEDDDEAERRLQELERRGLVRKFGVAWYEVDVAGRLALEPPVPRKKDG